MPEGSAERNELVGRLRSEGGGAADGGAFQGFGRAGAPRVSLARQPHVPQHRLGGGAVGDDGAHGATAAAVAGPHVNAEGARQGRRPVEPRSLRLPGAGLGGDGAGSIASQGAAARFNLLFVVGFAPLVVAGPGRFAHELLEDCGAKNAAEKAPTAFPMYSMEKAVTLAPDVVIDASDVRDGRDAVEAAEA